MMSKTVVSISEITYYKKEDIRILNSCLSNWFENPKILHFTSPKMVYPFNIKKWISLSYKEKNIKTIIIKIDNWIVGHLSIKYDKGKSIAHLFHLIIDKNQHKKGYAKKLILYAEKILKVDDIKKITLSIVKKNKIAKNLSYSMGYEKIDSSHNENIEMKKDLF